ncbi:MULTISPECIES: hypothetical protein [Pseudanabaena]|uniref:hypothetical protein n=1 Tax=Pseudanabaena TaxID=1152 RepID=UPI00247AD1EE|nr:MULTISPECIES: hypothetical protein [Pseudanabaena]MEA5487736.1 hypothetical protein [Pseudanabaena sp. CCNP1317]WGS72525.1 hypothetical protein OA858_00440 [Pseudanabaena galeata CCNP1313]
MTENIEIPFEANKDGDIPEDLPLGNYTPLLVPPSLGQSFLQLKFIYPLGAISLVNPDNLAAENDFEQLNNTFNDSPFFDQPLQSDSLSRVDSQATNQPNIQTKTIASKNNPQRQVQTERSPIDSPKSTSIQRKTVGSSQAQPLSSPLNLSSQELSANPSPNYDFQPSLDADTSENIDIQRSDDLSIIDSTNSNSDRPEQIQRTSDRSSANTQNSQLPLNSNSPVLETSIEQSNQSNPNKSVQRQTDKANLAFANNNLLEGDRSNQTESNLFAVDTTQSPQTDVLQRQSEISNVDNITQSEDLQQNYSEIDLPNPVVNLTSDNFQQIQRSPVADNISQGDHFEKIPRTSDSSTTNIQNPQIQLNSNLPDTGINKVSDSLAGDRTIQRASNLIDNDNIPQASQVPQADALQQQTNTAPINNPVNNISQVDLTQPIQRQPDLSISDSRISTGKNTQPIQRSSESGILENIAESDRTIQREPDLSSVDRIQNPPTDEIQRQPDISSVDSISQVDLTQQIQGQTDLSNSENTVVSNNTQQVQRFAESPVLDRVSESDRTIQREPSLSSVDNTQSSQSDPLQKQSSISNENTLPEINPAIQRKPNLSATDITQSLQTDAIRTQSNISVDDISQGDRTLQREPLGTVNDITQSDEVHRQTDVDRISQGGYTPQIQRQSDLANADSSIDSSNSTTSNIQPIQRSSESSITNNFIESDRPIQREFELTTIDPTQLAQTDEIQRQTDISTVDSTAAIDSNQSIQKSSETPIASESDRSIQQSSTLSNIDISQLPPTTSVQRQADQTNIADLSISDSSSTSNNSQQIQSPLESRILKNAPEGVLPIQRKSDLAPSDFSPVDRAMPPTDEIQRQPDVSVDNNISESDRTQPIQRQPALSVPDSTSTNNNIQAISKISESPVLDNIDQDDRTIQREPDLFNNVDIAQAPQTDHLQQFDVAAIESTSQSNTIQREPDLTPVDIKRNAQMNEVQKQTELNPIDSPFQGDRTIQQASNSLAKDITQVSQPDPLQQQSESPVLDSLSESDRPQLIQTKPDISTSDSSSNRNSPQQRFGDADISTVDSISGDIQRKSNLSPDLTQTPRTDDVSTVDNISQGNHTIQKEFNISDDDVPRSAQTDYIQRKADASVNGINQESPAQQIQQTDALITDNATASNDIQQIQREVDLSPPYISEDAQINEVQRQPDLNLLDSPIQSDRTIQKASELSPIDSMQILHTDEIQRQPDTLEVNSIAESDRPIQRESDLSSADSTQISQVENIQRQPDISTPDISTVDNSSSGDNRTQQIQTKSDLSNSDISTNRDSQQIQRFVDADISPVGSISDTLQQESDISAVDTISQGDRTVQRESDLFNNVDITQSPQSNDIQRQSDVSLNGLTEGDISQQIKQTDPSISDSNAGENIVQPLQINFSNVDSNLDIQQNTRSDELQRQSDISTVDNNIVGDNHTQQIQRTSDLSNSNSDASSNTQQIATAIESPLNSLSEDNSRQQTKSDLSTADISINRESQQIQRFVDADISDVDINSENIHRKTNSSPVELTQFQSDIPQRQPDIVLADNTCPTEQNIQREADLFNNIDSPQSSQTTDNQETSNLPVDAAEIISQGNLAPQTQPTNLSIADRTLTSNSAQSIQRESLVDNTSQSDRNISSEPAISALDVKQDSQASEIQRQPNISDVDRIAQSDRLTIQNNSDLPPADSTQPPQVDGIQRQSDESPVLDSRAERDHPQQIQTKPDLSTSNISINRESQQIQRFGDADIPVDIDIASDLSPVDITQSSPTNEIQRLSSIAVDDITQGDLTQQTQKTDSSTDSSVDAIQRQSDVSMTDISQSNYTPQRESNGATVIKNDITSSPQNEAIQRQFDPDISTVDNVYQNNSVIQRESDLSVIDTTQSSITNDAQSKLQREIVDSTIDNISQVDRIQPVQRNLDYSESSNVDSTLTVDRPNIIQRDTDLVALETEVSSQTSENLDHENQQQIQKKNDQEKENTTNNQTSVEQNTNQTILQMLADPSNTKDLQLPKTIENLAHTDYLGNFSLLPSLQIPSPITSQTVQRSPTDRQDRSTQNSLPNSLNNFAKTIQPMQDKNADSSNSQTNSTGWANISELLANLPPPPKASSSTSSLNKQTSSTSDRSPLASPSSPSTSSTSNQTTIQRSADSPPSDNDQDLYLTPTGLQKGNPNKITNTRSNTIQRELTSDTLPEAQVSVNTSQNNHSYNAENFAENLETLAQEIYILLKHRLETERERQGTRYQGRLPW